MASGDIQQHTRSSSTNGASRTWHRPHASELDQSFAVCAPLALQAGYSPVPIEPRGKRPLGELGDWNRLRTTPLTLSEINRIAAKHPAAGLGVVGGFNGLVPIDIDTEDEAILAAIRGALPEPLVSKRGRRGFTAFYRDPSGSLKARKFKTAEGIPLVEVLATGQTVIPPTLHPETGEPYRWLTECTLFNTHVEELPIV